MRPASSSPVLSNAAAPDFQLFVVLCAFAGLRLGEAAALQARDLDIANQRLHVRRQVQRAGGGDIEIRALKYSSERTLYLPSALVDLLAVHISQHTTGLDPERWLFHGMPGLPPHQNTAGHRWRTTAKKAAITGIKLHDLRHYYASGLIATGCDVVTVRRAPGHARATTTLDTYSHLWPTAEDRTRDAATTLMSEVNSASPQPAIELR